MLVFSATENDKYYNSLKHLLGGAKKDTQLLVAIVNAPFSDKKRTALLGLGVITLALLDKKSRTVDMVVRSDIELAGAAYRMSTKPFKKISIPVNFKGNFVCEAIKSERYQQTSDWQYLYTPSVTPEEAKLSQAAAGILCSYVYPMAGSGALIFSYYLPLNKIENQHHAFMRNYSHIAANFIAPLRAKV